MVTIVENWRRQNRVVLRVRTHWWRFSIRQQYTLSKEQQHMSRVCVFVSVRQEDAFSSSVPLAGIPRSRTKKAMWQAGTAPGYHVFSIRMCKGGLVGEDALTGGTR